jgi:hypothetical protein
LWNSFLVVLKNPPLDALRGIIPAVQLEGPFLLGLPWPGLLTLLQAKQPK